MTRHEDSYSNEYQKQAVEHLHSRIKHTAVSASGNSEIHVYLTRGSLTAHDPALGPYDVARVKPLPDSSEFECVVTLSADWTEVDFDSHEKGET